VTPHLRLHDGVDIPRLGLGVYLSGAQTEGAVQRALEVGYRHVDTAAIYRNEAAVGAALRKSRIPRNDVWITTKLWNDDHGYERALRACEKSLDRLGLNHVDLYLLHWPVPKLRLESWRALEELRARGLCRTIGVSNFTRAHLEELLAVAKVKPHVNQIELHPFLPQPDLVAYCAANGIAVEAYSPLTKGERLDDPRLKKVAQRHGRTVAQVLIRWALDKNWVVLPKSTNPERIQKNAQVFDFELSPEDRATLDAMDEGLRTAWDPSDVP
jgi:diketogulonate reductase-like aldo/keto reductase